MKHFFTVISFCISFVLFSQKTTKIDSLKKLGRDSLIKLAVKKLNEQGFNFASYNKIKTFDADYKHYAHSANENEEDD